MVYMAWMYQGWFTKWIPPKRAGKLSWGEKNAEELKSAFSHRQRERKPARAHLEPLDGQFEDVGRQLGGLLEGEVAPVDDEREAVDLHLRVLDQDLQGEQDGPQDVDEGVPGGRRDRSAADRRVTEPEHYLQLRAEPSVLLSLGH